MEAVMVKSMIFIRWILDLDRSGVIAGALAGATGIGIRGGFWAVTDYFNKVSQEEVRFSDLVDVCTVDPVTINFEFIS